MKLLNKIFLLFSSSTFLISCSNNNSIKPYSFDGIQIKEEYAETFYESLKNEFVIFDSNEKIFNYIDGNRFNATESFYIGIKNTFNEDFYDQFFVCIFNIVIGTSDKVEIYQNNNQIVYHIVHSKNSTDGLILTTIINSVKKHNFSINEFNYVIN